MRVPHLTLLDRVRIFEPHADVAELADAQVSEACDGDIVEVQVLSSAPNFNNPKINPIIRMRVHFLARIFLSSLTLQPTKSQQSATKICHGTCKYGVYVLERSNN